MLVTRRLIVPVWVLVVGLVALFQPPATIGGNVVLLAVFGLVFPAIWLILLVRRQHALANMHAERRQQK